MSSTPAMDAPVQDLTPLLTPYLLQSIVTLQRCYSTVPQIFELCLMLTSTHISFNSAGESLRAIIPLAAYDMHTITSNNPIPAPFPFIADYNATSIPEDTNLPARSTPNHYSGGQNVMDDIVEAIRQTTTPVVSTDNIIRWMPPTTQDIQPYMSFTWPQKYRPDIADAKGWKNSVNQCLTHGQGWNFLTYVPQVGKNKRHLLVERAFNGICVLGSGVCKGLNDRKPKRSPARVVSPPAGLVQSSLNPPSSHYILTPSPASDVSTPSPALDVSTPSPVSDVPTSSTSLTTFTAQPLPPLFPEMAGLDQPVVYSRYQ